MSKGLKKSSKSADAIASAPGFTWRSAFSIFLASLVFIPVQIYLQLIAGAGIAAAATVILIVFTELSRLVGSPIRKQESFIIYEMSLMATTAGAGWILQVQRSYFVSSPLAWSFRFFDAPLPRYIPSWWAPPATSEAYVQRTFLHPDWFIPLLLAEVQWWLFLIAQFALTILSAFLYIEVERLPFPLAAVDASLVTTISEGEPRRLKWLTLSIYPGLVWGTTLYFPLIAFGRAVIPLPWGDFTPWTGKWLPGALLGIVTDIAPYTFGLLIPFNVATYMTIGSIAIWIFGNTFTLTFFRDMFPEWASEYLHSMSLGTSWERSTLRVWIVPQIGLGLALSAFILVRDGKAVLGALKALSRIRVEGRQDVASEQYPSLYVLLALYIGATISSVMIFHFFIPDFPLWIPIVTSLGFSFLNAVISTASVGVSGFGITMPYQWNILVHLSDYRGVAAWLFPPAISGAAWVQIVKVGYLLGTTLMDVLKAILFTTIIYDVIGFFFTDFFWRMAPMPSSTYPYTIVSWPISLLTTNIWITRQVNVNPQFFIGSFAGALGILFTGELMMRFTGIPFSAVGLITGTLMIPPTVFPVMIGAAVSSFVLAKHIEGWEELRSVVAAGLLIGEGISVGIGIALALLTRAIWIRPW